MTNDGQNPTKAALRAGETIPVAEINRTASTFVVEAIALAGFKCVWVDTEHSHIDLGDLSNLILAARAHDIDLVVRLAHGPYNQILRPLELGADGLIWPHCKSAEEARTFVHAAKFRPLGLRGMGGGRDSQFGREPKSEYLDRANQNTLLGVMIEDAEGVENAETIAAVEGIDLLFIGPGDLSHSYGIEREPNSRDHPKILEAFDRVGAACRDTGKAMGTAVDPGESMRLAVEKGTRWLNCIHDMNALMNGYGKALQATQEILDEA